MRYELRSLSLWSFIKISFFFNLAAGFLFGLLYALMLPTFVRVFARMPGMPPEVEDLGRGSLLAMLIVLPLMGALMAAVFHTLLGAVMVILYNVIARITGGLEFNFRQPESRPGTWMPPQPAPASAGWGPSPAPPPPPHQPPQPPPPPPASTAPQYPHQPPTTSGPVTGSDSPSVPETDQRWQDDKKDQSEHPGPSE